MRLHEFDFGQLASLLWAWESWNYRPPEELLAGVLQRMAAQLPSAPALAAVAALWSLAELQDDAARRVRARPVRPPQEVTAFAQAAAAELARRGRGGAAASGGPAPRDLVAVAVALAALGLRRLPPATSRALQLAAAPAVAELPPSELTRLAWAAARLRWREPRLLAVLAASACARVSALSGEQLAQLCFTFASLGFRHPALVSQLAAAVAAKAREGRRALAPLDRVRVLAAWASGPVPRRPPPEQQRLLATLLEGVSPRSVPGLGAPGVAALLWALPRLNFLQPSPQLLAAAAQYLARQHQQLTPEQLQQAQASLRVLGCAELSAMSALPAATAQA